MKFEYVNVSEDDQIKLPIPENYSDCLTLIKSDVYRYYGNRRSTLNIIFFILRHPFLFSIWFRLCAYKGILYYPFYIMFKMCSKCSKIQIPAATKAGYGLYWGHRICMVINGGNIIGNNVSLSQFINIGTNHETPAIIGNNVYIGPHVCIVEDVRIGSNSTIGAGAVVTRDIPANSTCAGVPAKVLNYQNPGRYIGRRWTTDK